MSWLQWAPLGVGLVVFFWGVGAYNRLLRLKVDALTGKVLLVRGVKRPHSRGH